eukprot:COSAG01_NODE_40755_length_460_cov_0.567867_1_plen_65_part_01
MFARPAALLIVLSIMSRPVPCAGSAYCGGFDLPNVGQSSECLCDSNSRGGCYNVYGGGNSCWQQV